MKKGGYSLMGALFHELGKTSCSRCPPSLGCSDCKVEDGPRCINTSLYVLVMVDLSKCQTDFLGKPLYLVLDATKVEENK